MNKKRQSPLSKDLGPEMVKRHTMHDDVYERLRHAIMTGQVRPGQLLSHRALAAALGTSAMPVRDAVRRLVAEKALEVYPNRTIGLPRHTRQQFEEICLVRCALEGMAARHAATKISPAALRQLKRLVTDMNAATDYSTYMQANKDFHFLIYKSAKMPLLIAIIEMLWLQIGPMFNFIDVPDEGKRFPDHHGEIIDALARHDAEAAANSMIADINDAFTYLEPFLENPELLTGSD